VLDALCRHHVLERIEYPEIAFRFEHQQFQEFYAAVSVRRQLWEVSQKGDVREKREFTKSIVNEPAWAEPLGMIANDIGGRSHGAAEADAIEAGTLLIRMALSVDPVFASELARLCGPHVWKEVRTDVSDRLRPLLHGS